MRLLLSLSDPRLVEFWVAATSGQNSVEPFTKVINPKIQLDLETDFFPSKEAGTINS